MVSPTAISGRVDFSKTIDRSRVAGKTALVTGGASGIGAAVAKTLADAGARVTVADINGEAGEAYASELSGNGFHVQFVKTDVTNWQSQVSAFKQAIENAPSSTIDIVIAAAGLNGFSFFQDEPFLSEDSKGDPAPPKMNVIDVNLTGSYYTACLAIHYFRQTAKSQQDFLKADKQLIFIASNIAYYPTPLFTNYSASKAAVRALWVSLRSHPHLTGMRTNLVAPHIVRSPMTNAIQPILDEQGIKMTEVAEVVDAIVRLVCDDSIKGRALAVNPGSTYDLCDTVEEGQGAKEFLKRHPSETTAVFDFMGQLLESGVEPAGPKV